MCRMVIDTFCTTCCCALSSDMSMCITFTRELVSFNSEALMCPSNRSSRGHLVQMQLPELEHGHEAKSKTPTVKRAGGPWMTAKKSWTLLVLSKRLHSDTQRFSADLSGALPPAAGVSSAVLPTALETLRPSQNIISLTDSFWDAKNKAYK